MLIEGGAVCRQRAETDELQVQAAYSHISLGVLHQSRGQLDLAQQHQRQALAIHRQLDARIPADASRRNQVGMAHHNLAAALQLAQKYDDAHHHYVESLKIRRSLAEDFPDGGYGGDLGEAAASLALNCVARGQTEEAEEHYQTAEVWLTPLAAKDNPERHRYATSLASALTNWGLLKTGTGRADEALTRYEKAIDAVRPIWEAEPEYIAAAGQLLNCHGARAQALESLGRFLEAAEDWKQVVGLAPGVRSYELSLALCLARAGRHVQAAGQATSLASASGLVGGDYYNLGCAFAVCSQAAMADQNLSEEERSKLVEEYAGAAIRFLHQADEHDIFEHPGMADHLTKDADLVSLHDREDFKTLVAGVQQASGRSTSLESQP